MEKALKPFGPEPPSYHVEEFVKERNPNVKVTGGYRRDEAIEYMKMVDVNEE